MMSFNEQYEALTVGAGVVDFAARTRIEITGADRASFLHNLSTNDIKGLSPGSGCEAFFLNARGHVLAHAFLFCRPESLVIETVAGQSEFLLTHLNRYLIREKVDLHDRSAEWGELLVAGDRAAAILSGVTIGNLTQERLQSTESSVAGRSIIAARVEMTPNPGYLLLGNVDPMRHIREALLSQGAMMCEPTTFDTLRVEAGFPLYGIDISDQNLPQEVARDALAISFKKGCYLGQETVARIDALGHVNKTLVRLRFEGTQVPPAGTELRAADQVVGQVTSSTLSPGAGAALALGYVRRGQNGPGTALQCAFGPCKVIK